MLKRILVANRGEIACRMIQTIHRMGLHSIACYSEADQQARFVRLAHEAHCIGPAPSVQSYLNISTIIELAIRTQADAIHPGYGFLSENPEFARRCEEAGIVFIGPSPKTIMAMGLKDEAIAVAKSVGIPVLSSVRLPLEQPQQWANLAEQVGYPLLIKPIAGGGGKGMYVVYHPSELNEQIEQAQAQAQSAFGDPRLMLERFISKARHIEIQIVADQAGHVVHLGERDCSVQRRRQKMIEESPALGLPESIRQAMGQAAIQAAQAIGYVGAGTIEFLMDEAQQFYFMEMNTRLQVEHPVTEMRYGIDLVEWQIKIASGEPLPCTQQELKPKGHAIEVRINAEDPQKQFFPSHGSLLHFERPETDPTIRWDFGFEQGDVIPTYYDSLIAKLIVWDETREGALNKIQRVLKQTFILGIYHNVGFLQTLMQHSDFQTGGVSTRWLEEILNMLIPPLTQEELEMAAYWLHQQAQHRPEESYNPWHNNEGWRINQPNESLYEFMVNDQIVSVYVRGALKQQPSLEGRCIDRWIELQTPLRRIMVERYLPLLEYHREMEQGQLTAPMPALVTHIKVQVGQNVEAGQVLLILEAMKMQHQILAPYAGVVEEIYFMVGQQVNEGALLLQLNPKDQE